MQRCPQTRGADVSVVKRPGCSELSGAESCSGGEERIKEHRVPGGSFLAKLLLK